MSAPRTYGSYQLRIRLVLDASSLEAVKKQLEETFQQASERAEKKKKKKEEKEEEEKPKTFEERFREFLAKRGKRRLEGLLFGIPLGGEDEEAEAAAAGGVGRVFLVAGAIFFILEIVKSILDVLRWFIDQFRKASLVFDSIFRLLNIIWVLGIKPFADLIGILLRPFLILVLRYIVIPFYRSVMPAIIKMLQFLTPDRVKEMFPFFGALLDRVKTFFDKIRGLVASGHLDSLIETIGKFLISLVGVPIDVISRIVLWLIDIAPKLYQALDELWTDFIALMPGASSFVANLKNLLPGLIEMGQKLGGWLAENREKILDVFNTVAEWLNTKWESVKSFIGDVLGWVKERGQAAWEGLTGFVDRVVSWIKENGKTALDSLFRLVDDLSNWIRGSGGRVFESLKGLVSQVWSWISGYGARAVESLINFFIDVYNWVASTGRRVWNGLISSLTSMVNVLVDFINGIIDFINTHLGILGISIPRIPRLEAGPLMMGEAPLLPHISINVSVGGSIYGVDDLNALMEDAIGRAARRLYEQQVRGVR